jgi:hypothetical protein
MVVEAGTEIAGVPNVESVVTASQNVHPRHSRRRCHRLGSHSIRKNTVGRTRPFDSLRSLRALDSAARDRYGLPRGRPRSGRIEWCGSGDSNPDGLAATSS